MTDPTKKEGMIAKLMAIKDDYMAIADSVFPGLDEKERDTVLFVCQGLATLLESVPDKKVYAAALSTFLGIVAHMEPEAWASARVPSQGMSELVNKVIVPLLKLEEDMVEAREQRPETTDKSGMLN